MTQPGCEYKSSPLLAGVGSANSDLGRVQSLLLNSGGKQAVRLNGDQSILCLTAFSETTLASGVGQLLGVFRHRHGAAVTLVANDQTGPLEQALLSQRQSCDCSSDA